MEGNHFLIAYYYPISSIFIYDISKNSLNSKINLPDLALNDFDFINKDSIMLYGYSNNFENDSSIRCINIKGETKHVYPLYSSNIISSRNPAENLIPKKAEIQPTAHFVFDNKIFISLNYPYYGFKGYQTKYPLVGYYDLLKDSLILNNDIWYPEIDAKTYYSSYNFYKHSVSLTEKGTINISFSHSPTIIEWDFKKNKTKSHCVDSKFAFKIPFSDTIQVENSDYDNYNTENGLFIPELGYLMKDNVRVNYREMILPSNKYGEFVILRVFFDSQYNYMGEMIINSDYYLNKYKNIYYSCLIKKGRLHLRYLKPLYKSFDENTLKNQLDSLEKLEIEAKAKKKIELCEITGGKTNLFLYQKNDIIKYLQKSQQIQDTSFSIAILNKNGCGPCNEYLLQFIKNNQSVLFSITTKPMYLLYVSENDKIENIEAYLDGYMLFDKNHVRLDLTSMYKTFHPYVDLNPRLILVSQNNVVLDNIYMPREMEIFVNDLLNFYSFKIEKKN